MNRDNPLAKKSSVSLDELRGVTVLTYQPESPVYQEVVDFTEGRGLDISTIYDDEITLSSIVSAEKDSVALFCYSSLINAFDDVVCLPVREAPVDFHKTYVVSRDEERQPRVLQEFIDFMSAYRFPRLLEYR